MRLTELLELTELPEGAEALLENETLSPEEEARILAKTLAKAGIASPPGAKGEPKTMKRSRFGLMLLAGVLSAGAVVASAAGYFQMRGDLARHLGVEASGQSVEAGAGQSEEADNGESKAALVSQAGVELGASCTAEGWTITAVQALGDKTQVRILLDVTAPEGTVLEEGNYRVELPMIEPSVTFTIDQVEDEDPTDNKMSFVLSSIPAKDYRGKTMKLHIGGLSRYVKHTVAELDAGASPFDRDILVKGDFDLTFKLDYQDTSVVYKPGAEVDTANGKVTVDEVTLSPLSVFVKLSGEGTKVKPNATASEGTGDLVNGEKIYTFTGPVEEMGAVLDGEFGMNLRVVDKDGNSIRYRTGDTEPDSITMTFEGIIDPAEVACIVLNGVEVPLTE